MMPSQEEKVTVTFLIIKRPNVDFQTPYWDSGQHWNGDPFGCELYVLTTCATVPLTLQVQNIYIEHKHNKTN